MDVDGGFSRGFEAAAERLRSATFRDDLAVRQIPSPTGLAPDSIAFAADVRPDSHGDSPFGTGRFILLHDPAEPDAWDGAWRIVTFAQAPLEPEIGTDPLLADVAWSWLTDALAERGAACRALAGTATKTVSRGCALRGPPMSPPPRTSMPGPSSSACSPGSLPVPRASRCSVPALTPPDGFRENGTRLIPS